MKITCLLKVRVDSQTYTQIVCEIGEVTIPHRMNEMIEGP